MIFEANKKKLSWKPCEFFGCTNTFYGSQFQHYCIDERCKLARQDNWVDGKKYIDPDVKNIILSKSLFNKKIKSGSAIKIKCRAKNGDNHRCSKTFIIVYDKNKEIYPMFCPEHRNAFKRKRFLLKQGD